MSGESLDLDRMLGMHRHANKVVHPEATEREIGIRNKRLQGPKNTGVK